MARTCSAAEARANFSQLVAEAASAGQETTIERNNRPIAVIVGYEGYLALRQQAGERAARFAIYDEIRARNVEAETERVEAEVAEALHAARREQPHPADASLHRSGDPCHGPRLANARPLDDRRGLERLAH